MSIIVGNVDWMRNDYMSDIMVGGITYRSAEHAYQAAKFKNPDVKREIANAFSIQEARKLGRTRQGVQEDWNDVKKTVMESILRLKFSTNPVLADRLAKTGNDKIIMEGYDEYWGTGRSGNGQNMFGTVLETIRSEIQFVSGSTEKTEQEPTLYDAILNNPDEDLATACQHMFVGVQEIMKLVDPKDFDAQFIVSRTGVSTFVAEDAIKKLQAMKKALADLKKLVSSTEESEEEDEEEDDHVDPFLSVFD